MVSTVLLGAGEQPSRSERDSQRTDAQPEQDPWVPAEGERVGKHVVVDTIGSGAMGVVVRAWDPELDRAVAIKVVRPMRGAASERVELARSRLLAEARALARVSHPNVVGVYEVGLHLGLVYIAMELVEGCDLHRWLRRQRRDWREIVGVFVAAGRGLAHVHAAGIVHRDVKPANILVGDDGRARIGDFGIAHASTVLDAPVVEGVELELESFDVGATACTAEGRVVGTPVYMAPEQHVGAAVGPAADQFAFCVALFEALFGMRPFGADQRTLFATKRAGAQPPRQWRGTPRWLWPIVARGLSPVPEHRFAGMAELCDALQRDPSVRRRRIALVAAMAGVVAAGTVYAATRPDPCDRGVDELAGVWDPHVRGELAAAYAASAHPWALQASAHAREQLDGYARDWSALRRETCELGRAGDVVSADLLDRRTQCLQARRRQLAAVTGALATGTPDAIDHTFELVAQLRPLAPCTDAAVLATALPLPDDAATRAAVELAAQAIEEARAIGEAGRYREAAELAARVLADARTLAHPPLLAEALALAGAADQRLGAHDRADAELEEAVWLALSLGHDEVASDAAINLAYDTGRYATQTDTALRWARLARAALERRGDDPQRELARLEHTIGTALDNAARYDEALDAYEGALGRLAGDPAMVVLRATIHGSIAKLWSDRGEVQRERGELELAIAELEPVLGRAHPRTAKMRGSLALLHDAAGDHELAAEQLEGVVADLVLALGEDAPSVAHTRMNLAVVLDHAGRDDEATVITERAVASLSKAGDSLGLATALGNLGHAYFEVGANDAALDRFVRSVAMLERLYGEDHPELVSTLVGLARVRLVEGRLDEAEALFVRAETIVRGARGPWSRSRSAILEDHAEVLIARGHREAAEAMLAEATEVSRRAQDATPDDLPFALQRLAENRFALGRRADARAAAEEALALATARGDEHRITVVRDLLARIDR